MIELTKFDGRKIFVNAELILSIEEKPDTIITLTTGEIFTVREKAKEIVEKVIEYKRRVKQTNI